MLFLDLGKRGNTKPQSNKLTVRIYKGSCRGKKNEGEEIKCFHTAMDKASNYGQISKEGDTEIYIKFLLIQLLKHKEMLYE